jgi:UDP-glucuronate 4-epimerase
VNIGNSRKVRLLDFIEAIETELGFKAKRNYMDMQKDDVPATWAVA